MCVCLKVLACSQMCDYLSFTNIGHLIKIQPVYLLIHLTNMHLDRAVLSWFVGFTAADIIILFNIVSSIIIVGKWHTRVISALEGTHFLSVDQTLLPVLGISPFMGKEQSKNGIW